MGRLATNMTLPSWGVSRLNWFSRNRPTLLCSALRQQQTVWNKQTSVVGRFVCLLRQDRFYISSLTSGAEGKGGGKVEGSDSTWIDPPPLGSSGWGTKHPLGSGFRNEVHSIYIAKFKSPLAQSSIIVKSVDLLCVCGVNCRRVPTHV